MPKLDPAILDGLLQKAMPNLDQAFLDGLLDKAMPNLDQAILDGLLENAMPNLDPAILDGLLEKAMPNLDRVTYDALIASTLPAFSTSLVAETRGPAESTKLPSELTPEESAAVLLFLVAVTTLITTRVSLAEVSLEFARFYYGLAVALGNFMNNSPVVTGTITLVQVAQLLRRWTERSPD